MSLATSREQIDVRWEETATKVVKVMHPPKVEHPNLECLERAQLHLKVGLGLGLGLGLG